MKNNKLKLKFYINANHAVMFGANKISAIHGHTWEVATTLIEKSGDLNQFHVLEKKITDYLDRYKEQIINDVYPFNRINPTMENIGLVLFEDIEKLLIDTVYELECIEVLENPTRIYSVYGAVNYKSLESSEYESAMERELNFARGIEHVKINTKHDNDVSRIMTELDSSIRAMELRHKEKKKKRRKVAFFLGLSVILAVLAGVYYLWLL